MPGGDVNPYLALAAMIAAGLHGVDAASELPEPCTGNAYTADYDARARLRCARRPGCGRGARWREEAFGAEVVAHYANMARVEQERLRHRGHGLGAVPLLRADVGERMSGQRRHARRDATDGAQPGDRSRSSRPSRPPRSGAGRTRRSPPRCGRSARWAALAPGDRARLLRRFAAEVDAHVDELAALEVREAGHTLGNARWEAGNVRDLLEYAAGGVERLTGRQIPVAGGLDLTFHEPLGVVGVIVPWNFPMPIAGWGFAPALAAGNAVVLKPAETTPLTALRLAELALAAGLPRGTSSRCCPARARWPARRLVEHPDVRKIVFTGSTAVGRGIMARCADGVKRLTLELGGKSPNIVFADADLERAADPMAFLDNAGQDCCARTRILVQREVYDRFLELLLPAVESVVTGDPAGPGDRRWAR